MSGLHKLRSVLPRGTNLRGTVLTGRRGNRWSTRLKLMMNNLTEEEKIEATQPETVVALKSESPDVAGGQSVEIEENALPDVLIPPHEEDHQVIALLTSLSDELRETLKQIIARFAQRGKVCRP